ncbi:unnamed protein product, partial [Mesorhabditis belari]|uniref:Suppressor of G2 allele of SKP1 n=1 Tax=Mesorhabditis belari TaxID=2138241 RepID=A0AAF3FE64_9BILA
MASTSYRFDWFQTEAAVTMTVMKKNVSPERCQARISENNHLRINVDDEEIWTGKLEGPIDPTKITIKCTPSKIEVSMPKATPGRWTKLVIEADSIQPTTTKRDWDALEKQMKKEEEDEPLQGEAEVERMFKKIYASASDDTRRAMIKSYSESNGTVLSTNWSEISKEKTEVKPPDSMEYKKWEQ